MEDSSGGAFVLQRLLGKTGLTRADVRVVNLEVGGHLDALRDGRVAAAVSYAPVSAPLIAAGFQPIFSSRGIPGEVVDVLVVRTAVLRERPEAVDELLRWHPPVLTFRRTAAVDTELAGQPIRAGDKVVVFHASANRDERVFAEPDRLDPTRSPNPHVSFGDGPHVCLGAHFARLQLRVLYRESLRALPVLRTAGPPVRLVSNFINGIKSLPVEVE